MLAARLGLALARVTGKDLLLIGARTGPPDAETGRSRGLPLLGRVTRDGGALEKPGAR